MSQMGPRPTGGINDRLVDSEDMLPSKMQWNDYARRGVVVGRCRDCNGQADLFAVEADEHDTSGEAGEIAWYETRCANGHERAAPNGRVLRKSSAWAEMPPGWREAREERDNPKPDKPEGKRGRHYGE